MKLTIALYYHRVAEQAEENKMTASNLGIIFGPTLIKPRQTDAEVSLSSLVDYPYQALMVELLVRHFQTVFDVSLLPGSDITTAGQASPRLTPQEKVQRLSRHSTSLMDIKEVRRGWRVWLGCTALAAGGYHLGIMDEHSQVVTIGCYSLTVLACPFSVIVDAFCEISNTFIKGSYGEWDIISSCLGSPFLPQFWNGNF